MTRRREVPKREPLPDPKYKSIILTKFINAVMVSGKKSIAESITYGALEILSQNNPGLDPIELFCKAIDNAKPVLQVKSRRVGGATYQVPIEIPPKTRQALAFRWISRLMDERPSCASTRTAIESAPSFATSFKIPASYS